MLLAMLSFFMFAGISQAGQCIYLATDKGTAIYYDSSDVFYEGNIVNYYAYDDNTCTAPFNMIYIDCARRMYREVTEEWESIAPGSSFDVARQKLCK